MNPVSSKQNGTPNLIYLVDSSTYCSLMCGAILASVPLFTVPAPCSLPTKMWAVSPMSFGLSSAPYGSNASHFVLAPLLLHHVVGSFCVFLLHPFLARVVFSRVFCGLFVIVHPSSVALFPVASCFCMPWSFAFFPAWVLPVVALPRLMHVFSLESDLSRGQPDS